MTDQAQRTVAVTGATGLIGSHLCESFRSNGWKIRALVYPGEVYPYDESGIEFFKCALPDDVDSEAFDGVDVVFHTAYMTVFRGVEYGRKVNEEGTKRVLEESRRAGVPRFVFISSFSAQPDALSYYGRSKYQLEQLLDSSRDLALRPGLVMAANGGLFCRMRDQLAQSSFFPLFDGGHQIVQTIHIDDLCAAAYAAVDKGVTGVLSVAEEDGVSMREFVVEIARRLGKSPRFISIPHRPMVAILKAFESLKLNLPVSSENVLGLVVLKHVDTSADLAKVGTRARSVMESLDTLFPA